MSTTQVTTKIILGYNGNVDLVDLHEMVLTYVVLVSGTFTLSNLGMFGVDRFDAILPPGQARVNK